jgi:hypothetical protein
MDLTDLPVITLYQGSKRFNLLLDTGSSDNIIDSNILEGIKHKPIDTKSNLFGLEGIKVTVPMCEITLSYMDNDYEYEYLIKDMKEAFTQLKKSTGVSLHGIIGSKFFNTYKYVLDFDKLIAYSKK